MPTGEWAEVYTAHYKRLVALVTVVAGSHPDAEEAVQEAFARALGFTGRRGVVDDPAAWLYTVAVRVALRRHRRRAMYDGLLRVLAAGQQRTANLGPVETSAVVQAAIRRLPIAQREVVALYYLVDMSVDDIARALGVPAGTVKARLSRARRALEDELDGDEVRQTCD